ncbi:MAG TPA: GWxTD domain-containing protein, partial [Thermoanaerobaculia bacterium]|nr:GWxTD domain-containing protein [Thermoanaerobaculia bacterium]
MPSLIQSRSVLAFYLSSLFLCLPLAADDAWLNDVALLIGNAEREAYLRLPGDAERQEFIRRFWEVRDPYPQTERNELQEAWTARLAEARQRWDAVDDRSRALLLRGEPDASFEASCPGAPVYEFWVYEPTFQVKHRSVLVFTLGGGAAKLWQPGPDAQKLHPPSSEGCGRDLLRESRWIFSLGDEQYRALVERTLARPRPNPRDWYTRLVALPAEAPATEDALLADLEVEYPARFEDNSVVRVMMTVPAESLSPPSRELLVTGQVLQNRGVLEDFRYTFQVNPRIANQPFIPLVFERYLRPGLYKLRIKLVDLITKRFFMGERELSVPEFDPTLTVALDKLYEEADAALAASRPGVHLLR